jgi:hypothetical protein
MTLQTFFQASELAVRRKEAQWEQSQLQSAAQVCVCACACVCVCVCVLAKEAQWEQSQLQSAAQVCVCVCLCLRACARAYIYSYKKHIRSRRYSGEFVPRILKRQRQEMKPSNSALIWRRQHGGSMNLKCGSRHARLPRRRGCRS